MGLTKETLKKLCCSNGWSHGVFWQFDQRNSMLLTVEESYCEEKMAALVDNMKLQAQILGQGMIGQAALTGKNQWIFSDDNNGGWGSTFQDDLEIQCQFFYGLKTVAVIPIDSKGVILFGSIHKILESSEFADQTKRLFNEAKDMNGISFGDTTTSSLNYENPDLNDWFASFCHGNITSIYGGSCNELMEIAFTPTDFTQSSAFSFTPDYQPEKIESLCSDSAHLIQDARFDQFGSSFEKLDSEIPCFSTWSNQDSVLTSLESKESFKLDDFDAKQIHCVSKLDVNSANGSKKGLFSELGLEQLLDDSTNHSNNSSPWIDDRFSNSKRRKLESLSISCFGGSSKTMLPAAYHNKDNETSLEVFLKSQAGLLIDDSYSINNGLNVLEKSKKYEEPTKATRKRAKPGESTRPRPKDRQQIQDRIKELKEIIPNGEKCSIDALLERTIKYMLFLQSVTKYADEIKHVYEPKLIGEANGKIPKENTSATWAVEVGDESMACPIIVEDLTPPGLMLIEMLCEDQGLFLEIADAMKGFGLSVLKGEMETREDKIWARFIVQAKTKIKRIAVFWALVQLLQLTSTTGIDVGTASQPTNT